MEMPTEVSARQAPSDPVELIASQRVTLLAGGEGPSEHRAIMARSARLLDEDVLALDAELLGSVGLQTRVLVPR